MLAQSLSSGYQATRKVIQDVFAGFQIFSSSEASNQKSCAFRVALPTLLLLSNIAFRGRPSYIGTTLGTALLSGTVLLSDKIVDKDDKAAFGLQTGMSFMLLASSLFQLGEAGLPFYLSMATTVINGAFYAASTKAWIEQREDNDKVVSALHALFPVVWGGLMLSSQSSYSWMTALSSLSQPIVLGLALLGDYELQKHYDSKKDLVSSFGWLCLGASLIGTVTSFLGSQQSSHWVGSVTYGSALGLNLFTIGGISVAAYFAKNRES